MYGIVLNSLGGSGTLEVLESFLLVAGMKRGPFWERTQKSVALLSLQEFRFGEFVCKTAFLCSIY